ncbi:hypothetical protein IP91_01079 [Pseudoduganella lurida]|uniref:Uncharacterized protein n=1 Tax=Pseudoduganella lurida TaxID=1036180 RepID=A0A562RLU4_9BURK|nr:hypothetical protein [Pseudoduganella lurida]TWI70001.1 hypothetical protein IP91_01079 [Pseudoduganella lurida]
MSTTPATRSTPSFEAPPAVAGALRRGTPSARAGRVARMILWLAGAILILQLLGATQHRHDASHHLSDCAGCMLAAQLPAPPADPVLAAVSARHASLQYFLAAIAFTSAGSSISAPIPRAQGPPSSSL